MIVKEIEQIQKKLKKIFEGIKTNE